MDRTNEELLQIFNISTRPTNRQNYRNPLQGNIMENQNNNLQLVSGGTDRNGDTILQFAEFDASNNTYTPNNLANENMSDDVRAMLNEVSNTFGSLL